MVLKGERVLDAMERTNFRSSGFDYLRVLLSAAVVLWHSFRTSYYGLDMDGWYRPIVGLVLPMFFALSGFLVSGSLLRVRSIHEFALLRAIRILPALAVETVISMVLIGAFFTTLSLGDYFTHPRTISYLTNILGHIQLDLPGVFKDLPRSSVNASLWTIPYELECYLAIVLLWTLRIIRFRTALLVFVILAQIAVPGKDLIDGHLRDLSYSVSGRVLVVSFLWGVAIYFYRDVIRLSFTLCLVATAVAMLMLTTELSSYFVGAPAAYVTVYLGLLNPKKVGPIFRGDYSYGLYLYSYPIQQAIASLMGDHRSWYVSFFGAMLLAGLCAAFSWHCVEKPVLGHRKALHCRSAGGCHRGTHAATDPRSLPRVDTLRQSTDLRAAGPHWDRPV